MDWHWVFGSYHRHIVEQGKQPLLLMLLGLILGFGFIRTSTRLIRAQVRWWPGNVSAGGVHLHHELFGVVFMIVAGAMSFAVYGHPWRDLVGLFFGVGAGLVLDEFALLLHLEDVYWTKEGRSSIDAVIVAVMLGSMLLVHAVPFGANDISDDEASARWLVVGLVLFNLCLTVVTGLKGKFWLALLSSTLTLAGIIGTVRLATPTSPWARWRYDERRMERARRRAAPWNRRKQLLINLIGGSPSPDPVPPQPTGPDRPSQTGQPTKV